MNEKIRIDPWQKGSKEEWKIKIQKTLQINMD